MVKRFSIGRCNITVVLRHRFEKEEKFISEFSKWELGLWFRKYKIVGKNNFRNSKEWANNLVNSYTLGVNLFLFKTWIDIDFNGMHLEINE